MGNSSLCRWKRIWMAGFRLSLPVVLSSERRTMVFFITKSRNPNAYAMKKYGLKREDFLAGDDDLDVVSRLSAFFGKTEHVLLFDAKCVLSLMDAYQPALHFDCVELFPLLRMLYPDFSSYALDFLEEKFSIVRDPLVRESDAISMGEVFLRICSSSVIPEKKKAEDRLVKDETKKEVHEKVQEDGFDSDLKSIKDSAPASFLSSPKKVDQFDKDGNYIKTFLSIGQASRETGVGNKEIRIACNSEKMKKLNKGFRFQWSKQ